MAEDFSPKLQDVAMFMNISYPVFFSQGRFDWRNPGWTPAKYAYLEALCCYLFMKIIWVNIFVPTSWKFRLNALKWLPDPRLWRWNELRLVYIDIYIYIYMSYIFILYCMEINYMSSKDTDRKNERKKEPWKSWDHPFLAQFLMLNFKVPSPKPHGWSTYPHQRTPLRNKGLIKPH